MTQRATCRVYGWMLPPCFPSVSTIQYWFYLWRDNGLWLAINHGLLMIQPGLANIGTWTIEIAKRSDRQAGLSIGAVPVSTPMRVFVGLYGYVQSERLQK